MKKKYLFLAIAFASTFFASCSCSNDTITKGSYNLTLNACGGTIDGESTYTYSNVGTINSVNSLKTPLKAASSNYTYTFSGWYDGSNSSANAISYPYTLTSDTTFYAHYEETPIQTYNVTFDTNGGKFNDGSTTYTLNTAKVRKNDISSIEPSYEGHVFLGWWFSNNTYTDPVSFPYTPKKDITLYAMWGDSSKSYTITLDPNGGSFSDGTTKYKEITNTYVANYSDYDVPTKLNGSGLNYNFIGWGTQKEGTTICTGKRILQENLTLYAIWQDPSSSDFTIYQSEGANVVQSGATYTLYSAGTYKLCGSLTEGNIVCNAGDNDDINIEMNNCSITSSNNIPLHIMNGDKVKIKAVEGTYNYIYDHRSSNSESNDSDGGAIYSLIDLDLTGKGSLHIEGNKNNGVHCKKDLEIKNQTLYVKALNNAIRGNNSITIESGTITAKAIGGDGLKTSDNGKTSSGKQKGNINIYGGTITIDSYGDGIQAAYNTTIESSYDDDGIELVPEVSINTYKYADTGGEVPETATLYIRSKTHYSGNVYVVSSNSGSTSKDTQQAEYVGTESVETGGMGPGGSKTTTYYLWKLTRPTGYSSLQLYIGNSTTSYSYYTDTKSYNDSYNMLTLSSSFSSSKLSADWGIHDSSSELSSKGIKAENIVQINNGTINIKAFGNAIHANADSTIESTSTNGVGTINICGGTLNLYSDNKGVHADNYLNVYGGKTTVTNSYEGYEASNINIYGGETHVYAKDDGFNAGSKDSSVTNKQINVSGGFVDIQVASGDTDAIDSNGTFTQTGGIIVARASTNNQMSTPLDTDGKSTISGSGVFIAIGATPEVLRENRFTYSKNGSGTLSMSANSTHTINGTYSFTVTMSYSNYYYYLGSEGTAPTLK